ncbi:unnamed protein product [Linum tenue]|uniref:Uncharacterized protein n=1 Tax=Linum tenue TaxID=586396 RepID=A0AAV0R5L6_9ROSI|nr:unnamed protein product [Linum tenue]
MSLTEIALLGLIALLPIGTGLLVFLSSQRILVGEFLCPSVAAVMGLRRRRSEPHPTEIRAESRSIQVKGNMRDKESFNLIKEIHEAESEEASKEGVHIFYLDHHNNSI